MAGSSFSNWKLSSSESEEEAKGFLLKTKKRKQNGSSRSKPDLDVSTEEYVPLRERLRIQSSKSSDDELPAFTVPSRRANHETRTSVLRTSLLKRKHDDVIDLVGDESAESTKSAKSPKRKQEEKFERQQAAAMKKAELEERKALNSHLKSLKPEECMKHIECLISPLIIAMFEGTDFMKELKDDFPPTCIIEPYDIPCVRWRRKVEGQISHDEPEMLVVVPATEFLKMADAQVNEREANSLSGYVKTLQVTNPGRGVNVHIVCVGMEKYNKNLKTKQARGKKNKETRPPDLSWEKLEEALVDLQVECMTPVLYVETHTEMVAMIKQITKSVAESPYKRMKRQDVQFINEIPSVKVDVKTGEGVKKVWKQMIQQFHNVTTVMSSAIVDRYPSVLSLMRGYESCDQSLLSDISVRRGVGTIQTNRRIGPELSDKIFRFLTSVEEDERLY